MWFLLLACAKPPEAATAPHPQPRVPNPTSTMYVNVERHPTDALVARAWGAPLDESLSGAAGAVAFRVLRAGSTTASDVRWRAILAGYPWPIERAELARTAADEVPADLLAIARTQAGRDLGLVRAREAGVDQWVLLVGARRGSLPAFPREPEVGATLTFPGLTVEATSPSGRFARTVERLVLGEPGEWLVSLADAEGELARFPLYVDRETPKAAPFTGPAAAEAAGDLGEELLNRLDDLDRWYERNAADHEAALDAVARVRLRQLLAGAALPPADGQLAAAGYFGGTAGECRAATVADCLDTMWWSHSGHPALAGEWSAMGYAVTATQTGGVAISVTVASALPPAY